MGERLPVGYHAWRRWPVPRPAPRHSNQPEHRFNRQRQLAVDQNAAAGDLAESLGLEREKRSIERGEE